MICPTLWLLNPNLVLLAKVTTSLSKNQRLSL
jgi:hypothetical protein